MTRGRFYSGVVGLFLIANLLALNLFAPMSKAQEIPESSAITINRFKVISDSQYVELQNNTDTDIEMSSVQLVYYNDFDINKATSSKLISLSGTLPARGFYLINDR